MGNKMKFDKVGLIDNLANPDSLVLEEAYEAGTERYMAALGGNTGNLAFVYGTRKSINTELSRVGWGWDKERVRNRADALVITCANQIGAHADLGGWADAIERFDLPVILIGLGAQTTNYEAAVEVPEGTRRFLREVAARKPGTGSNIAVRGEFTQNVLSSLGVDSEPIGCPSLFISSDPALGESIVQRSSLGPAERIAVASGNPFHPENRKIEAKMVQLCNDYQGAYVTQHPEAMVALALRGTIKDKSKLSSIAQSMGFENNSACEAWFRRNAYSFHETQTWMHFLRHYDAAIGARYHGVALGVQAGIPGLVVHIDNRTQELARTTGIPSVSVSSVGGMSLEELRHAALWDTEQGQQFDANRSTRAAWMKDFLADNGITPSEQLRNLASREVLVP